MEFVYICRIIDGSDFDRIAYEAAFLSAPAAHDWAQKHYEECVEADEPIYKAGWRKEIETLRLMG